MEVCDYLCIHDMSRPVSTREVTLRPLSEQVRFKVGKGSACIACVNDANPILNRAPFFFTESIGPSRQGYTSPPMALSDAPLRYPFWYDEPPSESPFSFPMTLLFEVLFVIHYFGDKWMGSCNRNLWIFGFLTVLPVCSHVSDSLIDV